MLKVSKAHLWIVSLELRRDQRVVKVVKRCSRLRSLLLRVEHLYRVLIDRRRRLAIKFIQVEGKRRIAAEERPESIHVGIVEINVAWEIEVIVGLRRGRVNVGRRNRAGEVGDFGIELRLDCFYTIAEVFVGLKPKRYFNCNELFELMFLT